MMQSSIRLDSYLKTATLHRLCSVFDVVVPEEGASVSSLGESKERFFSFLKSKERLLFLSVHLESEPDMIRKLDITSSLYCLLFNYYRVLMDMSINITNISLNKDPLVL